MAIFGWLVLVAISLGVSAVAVVAFMASGFFQKGEPLIAAVVAGLMWWLTIHFTPFTVVMS
ncbi:hypothetical protein AHP1_281 [Aeromonas phage Ahp1_CNU-2021]|nr:hypothetical protein AHP1_281 [Aeromonas phage Ahp1_CNU-2021]